MAARMKDIAKALNVSIVTVSKVLNKKDSRISEATRQRVLACARQLDYRTNLAAKGLATGQSKTIGLIVPELFHGFFAEVAAGMSDALAQHGYGLIISSSRDDVKLENRDIRQMLARSVDALVVASCNSDADVLMAADRDVPVILLDRRVDHCGAFWMVGADDLLVGELAAQHLIDIGRKRIAFIGAANFSPSIDRRKGYQKAIREAGLKVPPGFLVKLPQNEESNHVLGAKFTGQLLKLKTRPDAIFCYNDPTAWGATFAIHEAGLRIPEDIAILGCGNSIYNGFFGVPLTSVDLNAARMGQEAANLALRAIKERSQKARHTPTALLLKPTLVVRGSTVGEVHIIDLDGPQ
jgi:LacI family transcriptional regulator